MKLAGYDHGSDRGFLLRHCLLTFSTCFFSPQHCTSNLLQQNAFHPPLLYPAPPLAPSLALAKWNNHLIRSLTKHHNWCKASMKSESPECEIYLSTNLKCSPRKHHSTQFDTAFSEPLWSYITQRGTQKYPRDCINWAEVFPICNLKYIKF